ncbi:hypothetical protein [Algoriphagus sp. A40]|uniref:hypothetical protein n=1 Tax=Algoriphagus sp. A40 TaxID=1945863 RepID=UPI00098461E2|nr:hypothetical protein [Algoriphagus sp. A40]OOG76145.1 hypothetical protein B0E43_08850 [Algoriphagus sp. A40]
MLKRFIVAVFSVWAMTSCTEDEVIPRTNPRFSVAFVQTVDATGVEFAANVVDYGSEEILEYGFVYGKESNLSISNSDLVSEMGRPSNEFKLKATHSMKSGDRMYVAAFIKTTEGPVYSLPYPFTSQGSDGFIFERLEAADEVYFGDTLRVFAKNLSKISANYSATIQGKPAQIGKVTASAFDIIIPKNLEFQEGIGLTQIFEIEVQVSGKSLKIEKALTFKAPIIQSGPSEELAYSEDLLVSGEFLYDEYLKIRYKNKENETVALELKEIGSQKIIVALKAYFSELNPELELVIRGNSYRVGNLLKLKKTELLPGQKTTFRGNTGSFVLKGENFNPHSFQYNKFEFLPDYLKYQVNSISPTEMEISYEYYGDKTGYRTSELFLKNGGTRSKNSFQIEWTAPAIPFILLDEEYYYLEGRAVSMGQKGYIVSSKGIIEVDATARTFTKVSEFVSPGNQPARLFAIAAEGKIYFGTTKSHEDSDEKWFYVFDPISKKVTQLPSIPSQDNSIQSIVYHQGQLIYQGDKLDRNTGTDGNLQRYKYDIAKNTWEKLPDLYQPDGFYNHYSTFEWGNEIYSISPIAMDNVTRYGSGVFKFNKVDFTWELVHFIEGLTVTSNANQSIVIGDKGYIRTLYDFYELDLNTWSISHPDYLNAQYAGDSQVGGFKIGEKFYFLDFSRVMEYDPTYFY